MTFAFVIPVANADGRGVRWRFVEPAVVNSTGSNARPCGGVPRDSFARAADGNEQIIARILGAGGDTPEEGREEIVADIRKQQAQDLGLALREVARPSEAYSRFARLLPALEPLLPRQPASSD
jgi:hypothetical protein